MTAHDLFDETFGQLDDVRRQQLDRAAATDPALADRRDRLRRAVALLLDDGDGDGPELEPPAGLAERTMALVTERPDVLEFAPPRPRVRWVDLATAAAVLLVGLMALVPAIHNQRQRALRLVCTENLHRVGLALSQYAATYDTYPYVDPSCPANYVYASFVHLHDAGLLQDPTILNCPSDGDDDCPGPMPHFTDFCRREQEAPGSCRSHVGGDYAYHMGTRDGRGRPGPAPVHTPARIALVADHPPYRMDGSRPVRVLDGNSPNHGGAGQNVLFNDGHVEWRRSRWLSGEDADLYLNADSRSAPGRTATDAVVTPAVMRFVD